MVDTGINSDMTDLFSSIISDDLNTKIHINIQLTLLSGRFNVPLRPQKQLLAVS